MERSIDWWEEMLGFKKVRESSSFLPEYGHARMAWLQLGDQYVELFDFPGLRSLSNEGYWGTYGTKHLSLCVSPEKFDDMIEFFKQNNVSILSRAEHPLHAPGLADGITRVVYVADPDGNRVEIQTEETPGDYA